MITNELEKLGFTPEEVKVYLALLKVGGGFVSTVARKAGTHRVTTYNTLDNLVKKGFVKISKKRGVKFYYAENPRVILNQFEDSFKVAKSLVPELIEMQESFSFKPKIQFFEGKEQIKKVFDALLESKSEVLGYTNFQASNELFHEYLQEYSDKVIKLAKKHRLLCPNDEFHREYIPKYLGKRIEMDILEIFAVSPQQFPFKNALYIYDDNVMTISFDKDEVMAVIIESKSNAETNRSIFNLSWLGATSFVAK